MNKIVKVISSKTDDQDRRLVKSLGWGDDDVQENITASSFGDDSHPVKDMIAIYSDTTDIGEPVIIGYVNKDQISKVGEKRIFSTDADGVLSFALHLKNDGTAEFGGDADFMVRYNELETGFNALKSDLNTFISTFNAHVHPFVGLAVGVPGITTPTTTAGSPSSADISGEKINEIKTL